MTSFAIALTIAGCNNRSIADGAGSAAGYEPSAPSAASGATAGSAAATGAAPVAVDPGGAVPVRPTDRRKLIRTGDLAILVEGVDGARARLEALAASVGGFVDRAEVEHAGGTASSATLVLRVPSDRFDEAMRRTRDLGAVTRDDSQAEDITDAFTDLAARLANARHLEQRLLKLVDERTGGVSDLLEVERELARVRGEIEAAEGHLRMWERSGRAVAHHRGAAGEDLRAGRGRAARGSVVVDAGDRRARQLGRRARGGRHRGRDGVRGGLAVAAVRGDRPVAAALPRDPRAAPPARGCLRPSAALPPPGQ